MKKIKYIILLISLPIISRTVELIKYFLRIYYKKEVLIVEMEFASYGEICLFDGLFKRYIKKNFSHKLILICSTKICNEYLWNKIMLKCAEFDIKMISNNMLWNIVSRTNNSKDYMNDSFFTLMVFRNDSYKFPLLNWYNHDDDLNEHIIDFGITQKDWYVCFFARDGGWENKYYNIKSSLHSLRNSNVNKYIDSMKYIISKGGYVIRLGKFSNNRLNYTHDRIIDLPFDIRRNDKSEFYFIRSCKFMISGGSGPCDVCSLFNTPIAIVNYPHYDSKFLPTSTSHFLPKLIKRKSDNSIISKSDWYRIFNYESHIGEYVDKINEENLYIEDNSEIDILNITKKMYELYELDNFASMKNDIILHKDIEISESIVQKYPELSQ